MAKKKKLKGRFEEVKARLAAVEDEIKGHYNKARELQAEVYQLELNYQGDVVKLKEVKELKELVKNHIECADRLKSQERFIANRELEELKEKSRFARADISHYTKVKERLEAEKEQLKQKFKRKFEYIDRELENAAWQLKQAETSLSKLEGRN